MFRNCLAAALRSLGRNRLHAGISILGLALGIAAALLAALVLRAEINQDAFVPARDRTYFLRMRMTFPGQAPMLATENHHALPAVLKLEIPQIEAIARTAVGRVSMRNGDVHGVEHLYWADPGIFELFPLRALAGDLRTALARPDGIVITPALSRKYFHAGAAIGSRLLVDGMPMTVTAVVEPPPKHGSVLEGGVFASALAAQSVISKAERDPTNALGAQTARALTQIYLRLPAGYTPHMLRKPLEHALHKAYPQPGVEKFFQLVPLRLDRHHLDPEANPGIRERLTLIGATGLLILLVACINFVNLATARASTRALEVGVRKALGASRSALIAQFLGEALLYVASAALLAAAMTELLVPYANAFLETNATFDFLRDPPLLGGLAVGVLVLALVAGMYPAFVLSSFMPTTVLKGNALHSRATHLARQALVTMQFAVLVGFLIAAIIIYQQRIFASSGGLRLPVDQHYLFANTPCDTAFARELPKLAGVRGVGCSSWAFIANIGYMTARTKEGTQLTIGVSPVDRRELDLYDIAPIAGRLFEDTPQARTQALINESAVRKLGYGSPEQALGKVLPIQLAPDVDSEVIGVVKDFGVGMFDETARIGPTIFVNQPEKLEVIDAKLSGRLLPETLAAIENLWTQTMREPMPATRFLDDVIDENYQHVQRQAHLFGILSGVAVVLSCLGLIGLSAAATARRTREIGVRKALGADRRQIVQLLLWQFSRPVIVAALAACPIAALLMQRWLSHFAYHVDLAAWPFVASTLLTLCVALLTVSGHCYRVARERPVSALRDE